MQIWLVVRAALSWLVRFFHISLIEAKSERRSSYLGILWGPLSTLIFTMMLALVFRHPHSISTSDFYLYVLAGYILWSFIGSTITSSVSVIQKRFDFAVHNNLSLTGLFFKLLIDRIFSFGLDLSLLFAAILFLAPDKFGWHLVLVPPLLLALACVSIAVAYIVNLVVILLPDLDPIITVGVRFMFFASPVFWGAEGDITGVRQLLMTYNPAAYFLSVFRQAFAISPFILSHWIIVFALSATVCAVGTAVYRASNGFVRNLK